MLVCHIAGYRFTQLADLENLRGHILDGTKQLKLHGTILLSPEGINIMLAGLVDDIAQFRAFLNTDERFADISFRESFTETVPFKKFKIKIKKEIITLRQPIADPLKQQAPAISPAQFKHWLDEKRNITILDTRNDYEFQFGAFKDAQNLKINEFSEFPAAIKQVPLDRPIVMYCTGGVRCEKAALSMIDAGYSEVYQLQGGILNYFAEVGGEHYSGDCFVFDERVALTSKLKPSGVSQCVICNGPIQQNSDCEQCANHSNLLSA